MCERPKLVLAIGSSGGYGTFARIMKNLDPHAYGTGAIYLAEHLSIYSANRLEQSFLENGRMHVNGRDFKDVTEGMRLERGGLYLQPDVYERAGERDSILVLGKNGGRGLRFLRRRPDTTHMGLSYSILNALYAGYGDDMMLVCLSGCENDGASALERIGNMNGNGIPSIVIQDPYNADEGNMPQRMIDEAERLHLPHLALMPEEIGGEINRFLDSF